MAETLNQRWAATLVGALVAGGVRQAVIAPGSRSTPLALAFADRPEVKCWSVIDERSAAFFALGLAKASGRPAAVVCTSGSAGAHFFPAVMEAAEGHTPLVLLTADRPWELHGFGAPQTVHQEGLFGRHVRAAEHLSAPDEAGLPHLAALTAKTLHAATSAPRGPVHLNVPFREPLAPEAPGPVIDPRATAFAPLVRTADLSVVNAAIRQAQRGVIVCGPRERDDGFGPWVTALGERLGFPVLAEAASNARFGAAGAIAVYDVLLRSERFAAAMKPDLVLRFGGGLTPKGPQAWLDASGARLFQFSDDGAAFDPLHRVEAVLPFPAPELGAQGSATPKTWRRQWAEAQAAVLARLEQEPPALTEPSIARAFVKALPPNTPVLVSSSMPIRDVDAFATSAEPLRVFANRGVNGIDGITSTALGIAAATGRPTAVLLGDLALLHDLSGWLIARRHGLSLTAVVVNNDGGGIFHFLPIAERSAHFEPLFGTPHGVDLAAIASLSGATLHRPEDLPGFGRTVTRCLEGGLHLIEVRTDRTANVAVHRALFQALCEVIP